VETELKRAMALLPAFDYGDPRAVRAKMDRYLRLSAGAGLWTATDPAIEVVDRRAGAATAPQVPVRLYIPRERVGTSSAIVYFHGGAFVIGHLDFEHPRCLEMAKATGSVVIAVDYRLAPEHPFPAGLEDCYAAFAWTLAAAGELGVDASRVAVAGASAGGALAAAVALMARDRGEPLPSFQLLLYPVTDDRLITTSMTAFVDIPGWNRRNSEHMWRHYLGGNLGGNLGDRAPAVCSPYAAPARADDLRGLPPAYVMTVDFDALRDEGLQYAQRLIEAGIPTELHHYPGTFHGFDTLVDTTVSRRARAEHYAVLSRALGTPDRISKRAKN
jgi:acetyl esterase/lipase